MRPFAPRIHVRPLRPGEGEVLDTVLDGLSTTSRAQRYLTGGSVPSAAVRSHLLDVDAAAHVAFVAEVGRGRRRRPIGLARYVVDGPARAEIAYEVVDDWHGRGVGTRLVRALVAAAHAAGLVELHATVRADNGASLALLRRHLPTLRLTPHGGLLEASASLATGMDTADLFADLQVA
jgi:ribosomal protein S18 acetylase RimI-like enzyme